MNGTEVWESAYSKATRKSDRLLLRRRGICITDCLIRRNCGRSLTSIEKTAKVVVPDYQLSLAIGKEGQNARLAARLTGYKIDIKSETQAKDAPGFRYEDYVDDYEDETEDDFDGEQE